MDTYYIYDLIIHSKYHFIYCHIDNEKKCSNDKIIQSCKMLYPFLRKYNNIMVSTVSEIRSFNELNQPKRFVRENGYHMLELRNKLFNKELSYINFYVKQYMIEYGIDNVRGGSYIEDFDLFIENSSLQNEICFPLHFIKLTNILQETMDAINEIDSIYILKDDKIAFIQNKLDKYKTNSDEIESSLWIKDKCNENFLHLESILPSTDEITNEITSIIECLHILLNISPDYLIKTKEDIISFFSKCKELYYLECNHLDEIEFENNIESIHCIEVCTMLLYYYHTTYSI